MSASGSGCPRQLPAWRAVSSAVRSRAAPRGTFCAGAHLVRSRSDSTALPVLELTQLAGELELATDRGRLRVVLLVLAVSFLGAEPESSWKGWTSWAGARFEQEQEALAVQARMRADHRRGAGVWGREAKRVARGESLSVTEVGSEQFAP